MKLTLGCIILLGIIFGFGCTPTPLETTPADAQGIIDSMVYVKAKNGLCFGVATVQRVNSNGAIAQNIIAVSVPCVDVRF